MADSSQFNWTSIEVIERMSHVSNSSVSNKEKNIITENLIIISMIAFPYRDI